MAFKFGAEKDNLKKRKFTASDLNAVRSLICMTIDVCYYDVYQEKVL